MKIWIFNRGDQQPMLELKAENLEEKKQLSCLYDQTNLVQLRGIEHGRAGVNNACGSSGDSEGIDSLVYEVVLGTLEPSEKVALAIKKVEEALAVLK